MAEKAVAMMNVGLGEPYFSVMAPPRANAGIPPLRKAP